MKNNTFSKDFHRFLILWASQGVSAMGTAMTNYALVIWIYGQNGTASSVTLLTLSSFLPTILFRFFAGAAADRWNKKRIMLVSDLFAACGTAVIFTLYVSDSLQIVHLYIISFLMSLMNAFQVPAAYVATSLLVPKEHYNRAGGLQAVSNAAVSILSPALGGIILTWGGMDAVLTVDLLTFVAAFLALLCIRFPKLEQDAQSSEASFWSNCVSGLRYLSENPYIFRLIVFIAAINFLAKLGPDGLMSAFVLSRTYGGQTELGIVQSFVSLGLLAGGMITTAQKSSSGEVKTVFKMCCFIFLAGIGLSISRSVIGWCLFAFIQYLCAAVMNVHWSTLMRSAVPIELQGRVFSARDTLQNCTIPVGLYLGGLLADRVFEPFCAKTSAAQKLLVAMFGEGSGAGMAALFFVVSVIGLFLSAFCMNKRCFQTPTE